MKALERPQILDHLSALADDLRSRFLLVLESHELTVTELCAVLQLPQSTVSRHLKTLTAAGWAVARRDGTRRLYRLPLDRLDPEQQELWRLARGQLRDTAAAARDGRRLETVLADRRARSREFFSTAADRWDKMRDELFGPSFYLFALLGLIDRDWRVADLGCGSGTLSAALAPFVGRIIAVDDSSTMLEAAAERLAGFDNAEVRQGDLEALPLDPGSVDAATLVLVLHHLPDPAKVIDGVARVLRPGGKLLIVDMLPHDHDEYQQQMGHVWMGFSEARIDAYLRAAGLRKDLFHTLVPHGSARGPLLFAATATRLADSGPVPVPEKNVT